MNLHCVYDYEDKFRRTVQISSTKMASRLDRIGHALTGDCHWAYNLGPVIQLFVNYDAAVDFQAAVFRRSAEVVAEDRLKKAMEGDLKTAETNMK